MKVKLNLPVQTPLHMKDFWLVKEIELPFPPFVELTIHDEGIEFYVREVSFDLKRNLVECWDDFIELEKEEIKETISQFQERGWVVDE
jgi:hypothetical protein